MLSKIMAKMHHHFPGMPRDILVFYLRLFLMIFTLFAVGIGGYVIPCKRMLAIEALCFQFFGAALLWWESNAKASILIVVNEFRLQGTPSPETRTEHVINRVMAGLGVLFVLLLMLLAVIRAAPHGPFAIINSILTVLDAVIFVGIILYIIVSFLKKGEDKVIRSIREADARSDIEEARQATRRALRTIGFALIACGTLLQIYPTWVG